MKHFITISGILTALLISSLAVNAQEKMKGQEKKMPMMDKQKQAQMMEMMQDSAMLNMMMEHMANNDHMRMKMMHKMMQTAKDDETKMMAICKAMMEDEGMHAMMMEMMQGKMQSAEGAAPEVLVKFKPDAKEEEITSMASEVGIKQVKVIKQLNLRVFKITSGKSVEEIIEHCQKEPYVEYAEPNLKYKTMN